MAAGGAEGGIPTLRLARNRGKSRALQKAGCMVGRMLLATSLHSAPVKGLLRLEEREQQPFEWKKPSGGSPHISSLLLTSPDQKFPFEF